MMAQGPLRDIKIMPWIAPGWLEALIPGRVRSYGTTEEVLV
jgi:hypothetical protein